MHFNKADGNKNFVNICEFFGFLKGPHEEHLQQINGEININKE